MVNGEEFILRTKCTKMADMQVDKVFAARQDLVYNEKQIVDAEAKIAMYEQELVMLVETMGKEQRRWWTLRRSPCVERARAVGERLVIAQRKVEKLERQNAELKKVITFT